MVQKISSHVQKSTLALMTLIPECSEVRYQGSQDMVYSAQKNVIQVLNDMQERLCNESRSVELQKMKNSNRLHNLPVEISLSSNTLQSSRNEIASDHSTDEDSDLEDSLFNDPKVMVHFEKFIKLGYSKYDVEKALQELGPECSYNDLLHKLIDRTKNRSDEQKSALAFSVSATSKEEESSNNPLPAPELDSSFDFNGSNNLRPIIIDGSNVAMR